MGSTDRKEILGTVVILIYRPDVAEALADADEHDYKWNRDPFAGIEIVAVEEATGGDYEDIIAPLRQQHPNAQFHIEEIQLV